MRLLNVLIPLSIIVSIFAQENYRLPTTVEPSNYHLQLTPYFQSEGINAQFTFTGIAAITLSTSQADVREIVLHSSDLSLGTYSLVEFPDNLATIPIIGVNDNEITQKKTFTLATPLRLNQAYILKIEYRGILGADMYGFYRSSYTENGQTK